MENYVIYANKQFNDWNELSHRLDVLLASKKHYSQIFAFNNDEQKKLWSLLNKYCHYNNIKLIDLENYYDSFNIKSIVVFKSKETAKVKKFIKFIKPLRIKPIIYSTIVEPEPLSWKIQKEQFEKELKKF